MIGQSGHRTVVGMAIQEGSLQTEPGRQGYIIRIHSGNTSGLKEASQLVRQLLSAESIRVEARVSTVRAFHLWSGIKTAIMANELIHLLMVDEGDIAVGTVDGLTAGAAEK